MLLLKSLQDNLVPVMAWEVEAAGMLSLTMSQFRFAAAFFMSVLVGALWPLAPSPRARHVYAVVTGFALVYYPFGNGCIHIFIPTLLTYLTMGRIRQHCGTLAWLINFTYLIGCHVAGASGLAWKEGKMDFTGAMMIQTLKVISAAMCFQDALKNKQDLSEYQQAKQVTRLPSLLEFLSYVFASGNLLAGPHFELHDYLDYIERRGPWDPKQPKKVPSSLAPGMLRFVKACTCMGLHLYLTAFFPAEVLEGPWYSQLRFIQRIVVMMLVGFAYRLKYYFAWSLSEAALIFSGFCWNGYDPAGRPRWNRYANTRIRAVELCTSAATYPACWNTCTGNFLRRYVYERLTPRSGKPGLATLLATQMVSGIWHGLFPGYAMFFISSGFMFHTSKVIFRYEQGWPRWVANFPLWVILKWLYTSVVLNYSAMAFLLLDWTNGFRIWRSVNFIGHFFMLAVLLTGLVNPPRRRKSRPAAQQLPDGAAADVAVPAPVKVMGPSHEGGEANGLKSD